MVLLLLVADFFAFDNKSTSQEDRIMRRVAIQSTFFVSQVAWIPSSLVLLSAPRGKFTIMYDRLNKVMIKGPIYQL